MVVALLATAFSHQIRHLAKATMGVIRQNQIHPYQASSARYDHGTRRPGKTHGVDGIDAALVGTVLAESIHL
jgi:hypothetical protein